ncbi:PHP domain-containing protein [Moorella sulfitireducens (nom. illeg.)]|uniref:PHP domain-containing protein n=1 Tax=Neomoorella sulfitireducens TaxID=2972948 RepID=UPI0021AC6509|nr:PHP domain-containing protein [Moorella sulfitireducens]
MALYRADLHVHTALSPCAGEEMIPPLIVAAALKAGLQIIAITDHNSAGNVAAVQEAARDTGLTVLAGMEVQTREEVHLVCLFDTAEEAMEWQADVYRYLPAGENREDYLGAQLILDAAGKEIGREKRLLLTSTRLGAEEVAAEINKRGGLCLPAHVDRPSYSLLANLGFIPPDLPAVALELGLFTQEAACKQFPALTGWSLVAASDAHYLNDIGRRVTIYDLKAININALANAMRQKQFRVVICGEETNSDK